MLVYLSLVQRDDKPAKSHGWVPWRSGEIAIGIALAAIALFLAYVVASPVSDRFGENEIPVLVWISSHLLGLALLAVVSYLGLRRYRAPLSSLGFRPPGVPFWKMVVMAGAALGVSLAATAVYINLIELFGLDDLLPPDIPEDIALPGLWAILSFEAIVLWTPIAEEAFFRGFVFAGLVSRLGVGPAILASGIIFSIFHLSPGLLVPVFITGTLLAWLYNRTRSLWASILVHAAQNAIALAVTIY